jgi:cyclopropane-fatty-acyl-phospholipid synthase
MLRLTCERAELEDGMSVLDLGCGWGSLSLWVARQYPRCRVVAVSNSRTQAKFIRGRCRELDLDNLVVVTADMNHFTPGRRFDRVLSVEMFEHMRNWPELYRRVASWLRPGGKVLKHVFCHREHVYPYVSAGPADWMAEHFFTGGMMPSDDLPYIFQDELVVEDHWRVNGVHYSRTLEAWLEQMDQRRDQLMPLFREVYGDQAGRWFQRWRIFFLSCSELFAFRGGNEWWVSHYRLTPAGATEERRANTAAPSLVPVGD